MGQETAFAMWKERCRKVGEFIPEKVDNVEGAHLKREGTNFADQFKLYDPYGRDSYNENLVKGFLRADPLPGDPTSKSTSGYRYAVTREDWGDGQLCRFTARMEAPRQGDKSYLKGYVRQVIDKSSLPDLLSRYGETKDDISTREETEYWIAGHSLKVIDLQTNPGAGFSGTLFPCIKNDPATGVKAGELVMSFRSTEPTTTRRRTSNHIPRGIYA